MKQKFYLLIGFLIVSFSLLSEECHVFFVQVPDVDESHPYSLLLNLGEQMEVEALSDELSDIGFSAIYTSDTAYAIQTATILAERHNCPVIIDEALKGISLNTLFKRVGGLRTFGAQIFQKSAGKTIACVTHKSLINFIGRYASGGFSSIPHFSWIQINSDGKSLYLPKE